MVKLPRTVELLLSEIFYDSKTGFGSIEETYRAAKKLEPFVRKAEVRAFIQSQEVKQTSKELRISSQN